MEPLTPERIAELDAEFGGKYAVQGELGRGGMGVVYLARQTGPLDRRVAIKIVKIGMDTEAFVHRFEAERRSLAAMSHPGIAAVLDAGATASGRPYYVMELVEGEGLLDHCDHHRLPLEDRLRLFAQVCLGVQHAHQKGVVHRDLKPSNILIVDSPQGPRPKIIDFGIAKAMDEAEGLTGVNEMIGTPAYMSPEQAAGGGDVDTRADIYSLGIVLYQLLAGCLPFEDSAYRGWAAVATSMTEDVPPPSRRVQRSVDRLTAEAAARAIDPARLARRLRGDLDWIVLRATERDRERRYATVAELHDDVRRHLEDRPVSASPPSRGYRARKFVRRNPVAVGLAGVLVVAVVGFGIVQAILRAQVERARDDAVAARDDAEQTLDFMIGDLYEQLQPIGQLPILLSVGEAAMRYFADRPLDEFSDDELASRSQALHQLGRVHLEQGELDGAQDAFEESLRLSRGLSDRDPSDAERLFDRGQSEFWVAELARRRGDLPTAQRHFEAYRDISSELVTRDPANPTWRTELGYSHTNMGVVYRANRRLEDALREFEAAFAVKRELAGADPTPAQQRDLAAGLGWMSLVALDLGRLEESGEHLERQLALWEELGGPGASPTVQYSRGVALLRAAQLAWEVGELDRVAERAEEHGGLMSDLAARDPTNTRWRREAAISHTWLGRAATARGDLAEGEAELRSAVEELRALMESTERTEQARTDLSDTLYELAVNLARQGRTAESLAALTEARALIESDADPEQPRPARIVDVLLLDAQLKRRGGDPEAARPLLDDAVSLARLHDETSTYLSRVRLARALLTAGALDEARPIVANLRELGSRNPDLETPLDLTSS